MAETAQLGRPTEYTPEIADQICTRLAHGESLRRICLDEEMPPKSTVLQWVLDDRQGFYVQYTRARQIQAEGMADEIFEKSDDDSKDVTGELEMPNGVAVQRSRLMVDTRKWYLSKVLPKVYGDKVENTLVGKDGGPIQLVSSIPRPPKE